MSDTLDSSFQPKESYTQEEVDELLAINRKLHKQIIKHKMEILSLKERIAALEDELKEEKKMPKLRDVLPKFGKASPKSSEKSG